MHHVPSAGPQTEVHGRGVEHHPVPHRDGPDELGENIGATVADLDPLKPGALAEDGGDRSGAVGGHAGGGYRLAISFSTRSSRDLKGSLHRTVRCAWSFSLRWTQSTVKSLRRSLAFLMNSPRKRARVV